MTGQPVVEKFQHGEAAEDALQDHPRRQRQTPSHLTHGRSSLRQRTNGENDDEQAEDSGYDAVGVLKGDCPPTIGGLMLP